VWIVLGIVLNGYALSVLWGWFMVPTFNLPKLTVAPAIGIAMVVGYLTQPDLGKLQEKEMDAGTKIVYGVIYTFSKPAFALLFGWIILQFM